MILVVSSVWIAFFRGTASPDAVQLEALPADEPLLIGDLITTEVLQGFTNERDFNQACRLLGSLDLIDIGGREIAVQAALNCRTLRALGVAVRKTLDTLIATHCIEVGIALLHTDRDCYPFREHLGRQTI